MNFGYFVVFFDMLTEKFRADTKSINTFPLSTPHERISSDILGNPSEKIFLSTLKVSFYLLTYSKVEQNSVLLD